MSSIAQALTDKSFLEAKPDDQRAYIAAKDPAFAKASKEDQDAYYNARVLPAVKQHSLQLNAPENKTQFELERTGGVDRGYLEGLKESIPTLGSTARRAAFMGLDPIADVQTIRNLREHHGAADIGGAVVGIDAQRMRERAEHGDTAGILGEATIPTIGAGLGLEESTLGLGRSGRLGEITARAARDPEGRLRPIVNVAARGLGAVAGHYSHVPEGPLIGAIYGAKAADALIPQRVPQVDIPGGAGAHLPAAEEFYEHAGEEADRARRQVEQSDREREAGHREFAGRVREIETARQKELADQARLQRVGEGEEQEGKEGMPAVQPIETAPAGKARSPRGYFNPGRAAETVKLDDLANRLSNVRPLQPDVPLREQLTSKPAPAVEAAEIDPIKAKYPDSQVRQIVRANGERIYEAAKGDPALVKSIHDLTRVDLRQALINAGEDVGQTTVSNSKFAGEGSISREQAFNRLLDLGKTPKEIVDLAKPKEVFRAHDEGNPKMDLERSHAHATSSAEEAERYAESRNGGENQQVSKTDLSGLKEGKDYTRFKGPNGQDWIRFHRQVEWEPVR